MNLNADSFIKVSQIIERDSKDTSYKFALIRATIDVINEYHHLLEFRAGRIHIPTGLIVEKWLWYYYPLISSKIFIPQKNGEPEELTAGRNISFRSNFMDLVDSYKSYGDFQHFYQDYKKKRLPVLSFKPLASLINKLYYTITMMPMKYIGRSIYEKEYSIYQIEKRKVNTNRIDLIYTSYLLEMFGTFSIPEDYYLVLKYMGSFIGGPNALVNKWAEFTIKANRNFSLPKEYVLNKLLDNPERIRDISSVKSFYQNMDSHYCVWSGKKISTSSMNIDHVLPFTHYLNNDIWNLLPAKNTINNRKRDKVPTPNLIDKRSELIIYFWRKQRDFFSEVFTEEAQISLNSNLNFSLQTGWESDMLNSLKTKSEFLISVKGLEEFNI